MKGLELAEKFFNQVVSKLIEDNFPFLKNNYAGGLLGYGSDILGHDDELSKDHEWGPRCNIWLSNDDYNKYAEDISKMLDEKLPKKFLGYSTRYVLDKELGAFVSTDDLEDSIHHVGISTVSRYLKIQHEIEKDFSLYQWLCIPEQKLLELTRGKIFYDPVGDITRVRKEFEYLPDEIWKFKMLYAWSSLNDLDIVWVCSVRDEMLSSRLVVSKIIERIVRLTFLLNRKYYPGTMKWFSREFYNLPKLAEEIGPQLEKCLVMSNMNKVIEILENVFKILLDAHNDLEITDTIKLTEKMLSRGFRTLSFDNILEALSDSLPTKLKEMEIWGGCDQWITNSDILVWSEQYIKFEEIYKAKSNKKRDGEGDRII
ncbi:uncharacterized protein DUF4037 [Orenia metallireducens]|uniref:DUF4037 domain-containing protein n=1 Tax=Orenia metallireducens TaxID=1413210 RepID=A0A285I0A0_9FIRM|nr:DUF4037 domain-containing protein [Orenia metallireducens]PRX29259.1 uncharacterized protein DUF4037 [Orenia metallireducens]SNY40486.1 protein of unknown function [Orenia metallireducens]